jgi:hypothetical protein
LSIKFKVCCFSSTNHEVILFHFAGEIIGGSLELEEEEITDSKWVPLCEVGSIENKELRNPEVIKQIINAVKILNITL